MEYVDIKKRMNDLLCCLLEQDARNTSQRTTYEADGIPPITPSGLALGYSRVLLSSINSPDFREKHGERILKELTSSGVVDLDEISLGDVDLLINEYLKVQQTYQKVIQHRATGDFSFEEPFFVTRTANHQSVAVQSANRPGKEKTLEIHLSEIIDKYIETKISDGNWRKSGIQTNGNRLFSLIDILGDIDIKAITREDMRTVREILRKLPPNRQRVQKYKGKSVAEVLTLKPEKTLSVKTINMTMEAISSLFEWGIREGILYTNPAKGLQLKDDRQAITLRDSFTYDDVQAIFNSPQYTKDRYDNPAYFWIPLIALYSGMRREEIAQLYLKDVYQHEDGTWVFDINDNPDELGQPDKQVKNVNAKRLVPIHEDLRRVGLLEYHARMVSGGADRLFPHLNKTKRVTQYGKQPGKQLGALVELLNLSGKKSFHSFRHTFSDFFKQRGAHTDVFRQVYGHEIPGLAGHQYGSKFPPKKCLDEVVGKLNYDLDLILLSKSRHAWGVDNTKIAVR